MIDGVERRIGPVLVRLDRLLCVGFGDCIDVAPDLWELDGEGIVRFREPVPAIDRERLLQSCAACPVDALTVLDPEGKVLVP